MGDLSQLSTEELLRMRGNSAGAGGTSALDLSSLSTEQLLRAKAGTPIDLPIEKPNALVRLGRGFEDVRSGVKQLGTFLGEKAASMALGEPEINPANSAGTDLTRQGTEDLNLYERGRGPDAGMDWMRLAGNVLGTAPTMAVGGAASLGGRMALGAGQGAASSAAMFTPEHESKLKQTLIGAGFGAAMPVVLQGVKMAYGGAKDKVASYSLDPATNPALRAALSQDVNVALQAKGMDFNALTQETRKSLLNDAAEALKVGGKLDADALARKAQIETVGAKPTRASVTRSPQDWQFEQNTRGLREGIGDPIVKRAQDNAAAMTDYLGKLRSATGGKATTPYEAGESAVNAIKAQDAEKEKVVSGLYDAYRSSGGLDLPVPDVKLASTLGKVADEIGTENIPAAVLNRLKSFGLMDGERTKLLTVNEADKLNRLINNNNPGNGPASLALGKLKSALNESLMDIEDKGVSEALTKARGAAAQRFAEQDASKGIGAAIDDVHPDRFVKRFIIDAPARDMKATLAELSKSPQGTQAVSDVKGHVLDTLLLKATGKTNVDDVAGAPFSGVRFSKALDGIEPEKLHALFNAKEIEALRTLQKASKYLTEEVPFSDVNHSKTTAALANLMMKIGNTPLLGGIAKPIIGAFSLGQKWMEDSTARRAVAEALAGGVPADKAPAASLLSRMNAARSSNAIDQLAPGMAGAFANQPSRQK